VTTEVSRARDERQGRGGCPSRQRSQGWTVNEIPSSPGSLPTVRSDFCGRDWSRDYIRGSVFFLLWPRCPRPLFPSSGQSLEDLCLPSMTR
jgi:hypothetical protein